MLYHNDSTRFSITNLEPLLSQLSTVIDNHLQDFITLQQYVYKPIKSDSEVLERAELMDELMDMATSDKDIVMMFANAIADRIEEYEDDHIHIPKPSPHEVLAELMKLRNIKQVDLEGIAKQSVISDLLNEKRSMNLNQAKGFAKFFNVSTELFMG